MKKLLALALISGTLACFGAEPDSTAVDSTKTFIFTDVISLPTTSVKDQNKSGTCWCFAGTSYFEDEVRRIKGDSLDISEMFTVRKCYEDKADRYVRMYGHATLSPGGSLLDVPYVWARYGAVPEEVYPGNNYGEEGHVHGELDAAISAYVKAIVAKPNRRISTAWKEGLKGILDAYFGPVPETFEYNGKTYTPQSYAASLGLNMDDYVPVTSFTHHPYYEKFIVEVPDNWLWGEYYNVPLEDMMAIADNSLNNGYTFVWASDISEGGFKWNKGVALMPKGKTEGDMNDTELARWVKLSDKERQNEKFEFEGPVEEIVVTPEMRQEMFDRQETTDDHGMEIIGLATDQLGNKYYKVKNSWNTNQVYDGFFYVSMPFFEAKTIDILVHKDAIPKDIARKMGIKQGK